MSDIKKGAGLIEGVSVHRLPAERGFVLVGAGAHRAAEECFGAPVPIGQVAQVPWEPGAPSVLVLATSPTRVEVRIPDQEPWATRLAERLTGVTNGTAFAQRLARAIGRLEAWHESDADSGASPEDLAAELAGLRRLAPSAASAQAVTDALDALDDGLPADAIAAALYRAGLLP